MTVSVRRFSSSIGAAATAAVVTFGLVTLPPERYDSAIVRTEVAAVQLKAAVSTQIALLAGATATTAAPAAAPAAPQASATGDANPLTAIATAAILIAASPLWYVGFPVTLPLSVIGGIALFGLINALPLGFGGGGQGNPLLLGLVGAVIGAGFFAVAPFALAIGQISSLSSTTAAAAASRPARSAAAAQAASTTVVEGVPAFNSATPAVIMESISPPNRRERGSAQRGRSLPQSEAATTAPADAPPATPTAVPATATTDETITPTQSELAADATRTDAADTGADSPPADAAASSTATQQSNQAPSRQREGKTRASRAAADASRAS